MGCWYMKVSKFIDGWSLWKSNSMCGGVPKKSAVFSLPHVFFFFFFSGIALTSNFIEAIQLRTYSLLSEDFSIDTIILL